MSLTGVSHTGASCPAWLKRWWLDRIGAEHLWEVYGSSEGVGVAVVRGDEWLANPGTVGKPANAVVEIRREDGTLAEPGEAGRVFLRPSHTGPGSPAPFAYVGADMPARERDGFVHLGDLGHLNDEGFLFISDRRSDMIVTGGFNVYPSEVEALLSAVSGVVDAVVVGLPDEEWGSVLHAIVETAPNRPRVQVAELERACRAGLARYKVPKSFEIVDHLPRMENGKVRRRELIDERIGQAHDDRRATSAGEDDGMTKVEDRMTEVGFGNGK